MKKRLLTLLLALTIAIFPTFAFAASDKGGSGNAGSTQSIQSEIDFDDEEDIEAVDEEQEQLKEWIVLKDALEAEKDAIELQKDELELDKADLEVKYEAAKESGDLVSAADYWAQIEAIRAQIQSCKLGMKAKIQDMHEEIGRASCRERV